MTEGWLRAKAAVEVRSDVEGFIGVWYEATVLCVHKRRTRCDIEYNTLLSDSDPSKFLRETVRSGYIRPRPLFLSKYTAYKVHDFVEVFFKDGWWCGVVMGVLEGEGRCRVAFPTTREEMVVSVEEMRPGWEWVKGLWSVVGRREGAKHKLFTVSTIVQVSRLRDGYGISWFAARIKKVICYNTFLVEYRNIKVDSSGYKLLTEIVDIQFIRPLQMLDPRMNYMVEDKVEVLLDGGWCSGVVVQILEDSNYKIKLDHSQEEKEFNKSIMRGGCQWNGFEWVAASKGKSKKSGSPVKFAEKEQVPFVDKNIFTPLSVAASSDKSGASCVSNSSLSKRKKVEGPSPGEQIGTSNSRSSKAAEMVEVNVILKDSFSQDGCSPELLIDYLIKSRQTSKNPRKMKSLENDKSPDNMLSDGGSSELPDAQQMRNYNNVPESPLQSEILQVDDSDRSMHLYEDLQTKISTFNQLEDRRNSKGGYSPSINCKTEVKALADDDHTATVIMNGSFEGHIIGVENVEESTTVINDYEDDRKVDDLLNKKYKAQPLTQQNRISCHDGSDFIANTQGQGGGSLLRVGILRRQSQQMSSSPEVVMRSEVGPERVERCGGGPEAIVGSKGGLERAARHGGGPKAGAESNGVKNRKRKAHHREHSQDIKVAKKIISWNAANQPLGDGKSKLFSCINKMAKGHFPLSVLDWHAQSLTEKDTVWGIIKSTWELEDIRKDWVMNIMGKMWWDWKYALSIKLVQYEGRPDAQELIQKLKPVQVSEEAWKSFVESKLTDAFKEKMVKVHPSQDIMENPVATVLGLEHPERVHAASLGPTPSTMKQTVHSAKTMEELWQENKKIREENNQLKEQHVKLEAQFHAFQKEVRERDSQAMPAAQEVIPSDEGSNAVTPARSARSIPIKVELHGRRCKLLYYDSSDPRAVAEAVISGTDPLITCQGQQIGKFCYKVEVVKAIEGSLDVAIPSPGIATLEEAVGSFIIWPRIFINLQ